jgi:hypothetical protein
MHVVSQIEGNLNKKKRGWVSNHDWRSDVIDPIFSLRLQREGSKGKKTSKYRPSAFCLVIVSHMQQRVLHATARGLRLASTTTPRVWR